ncbi:MAG: Dabb family protein [Cyclobacteriaceae bacterium]
MEKQTRRNFIAGASIATLGVVTPSFAMEKSGSLIHHVFFWLKNPASKEDFQKLIEGIKTLQQIESLQEFVIGVPAQTPKRPVIDESYSISLFTRFKDVAAHNVYQDHPIHKKFVEAYSPLWNKVQVYDSQNI